MAGPRRGKPIQPRTLAICAEFDRRKAGGEREREIVGDLKERHQISRTAIWKALRSGGSVAPYRPSPARAALLAEVGDQVRRGEYTGAKRDCSHPRPPPDVKHAPAEPCGRCGVRADLGCKHRPAEGPPPPAIESPGRRPDRRFRNGTGGQGMNFHIGQAARNIPSAIAQLRVRRLNADED